MQMILGLYTKYKEITTMKYTMLSKPRRNFLLKVRSWPALLVSATVCAHSLVLPSQAGTYSFAGKCGFLLESSYQENCTALFDDDVLTLMPKGSRQIRILPQQIVYVALADKTSMKMNEGLELYNKAVPWWMPWSKVPGWVKDATNEKVELHQFSIGYVDKNFNPKIALFVLNDISKASAMSAELQASSGLQLGDSRRSDRALDDRLRSQLNKNVQRQSQRLTGMCSQWMFEDAEPVADALNAYVNNTIDEISIFDGSVVVAGKLRSTAANAFKYCDGQIKQEIAQAAAEERARLEAIRRRNAAAAAASRARANAAVTAAIAARRSSWDMLAGSGS